MSTTQDPNLTDRQQRFVEEYLVDLCGAAAARRAGYGLAAPHKQANRLMQMPKIREAIDQRMKDRAERLEITQDWVLSEWKKIYDADPRELEQYVRFPCKKCWPDGAPFGPDEDIYPNPECGACYGFGEGRYVLADTRDMSEGARALFAGVQGGKDGVRAKMLSKDQALVNIARHLGMFTDRVEHSGPDGKPIEIADASAKLLDMLTRRAPATPSGE